MFYVSSNQYTRLVVGTYTTNVLVICTVYPCNVQGWSLQLHWYIANFWYNNSIGFRFPVEELWLRSLCRLILPEIHKLNLFRCLGRQQKNQGIQKMQNKAAWLAWVQASGYSAMYCVFCKRHHHCSACYTLFAVKSNQLSCKVYTVVTQKSTHPWKNVNPHN